MLIICAQILLFSSLRLHNSEEQKSPTDTEMKMSVLSPVLCVFQEQNVLSTM